MPCSHSMLNCYRWPSLVAIQQDGFKIKETLVCCVFGVPATCALVDAKY